MYIFKIACIQKYDVVIHDKGPCKVKNIPDIQKKIGLSSAHTPDPLSNFLGGKPIIIKKIFWGVFQLSIQNGPGPTHPLPISFGMFGIFCNFATSLSMPTPMTGEQLILYYAVIYYFNIQF